MLKIIRWWKLTGYDPTVCEGYEINDDPSDVACLGEVSVGCETDNGSRWKVCPDCAKRLGYRNSQGE